MEQKQLAKKLPHFTWNLGASHLPPFRWQKDRTPQGITPMIKGGHLGVIRMLEEMNPIIDRWNKEATDFERWEKDVKASKATALGRWKSMAYPATNRQVEQRDARDAKTSKLERGRIHKSYRAEVREVIGEYAKMPFESLIKGMDLSFPVSLFAGALASANLVLQFATRIPHHESPADQLSAKIVAVVCAVMVAPYCVLACISKTHEMRKNTIYQHLVKAGIINPPEEASQCRR